VSIIATSSCKEDVVGVVAREPDGVVAVPLLVGVPALGRGAGAGVASAHGTTAVASVLTAPCFVASATAVFEVRGGTLVAT
jgi:hypothetical protein